MFDPAEFKNIAAGAGGSAVAAWLARATGMELVGMFVTGFLTSYFIGPAVAVFFGLGSHASAVGFVVGFLAIMVLRKLIAVVESFPAESIGGAFAAKLRQLLGVSNADD